MDAGAFTTIISNLGFPIACVIAMFYMWNKEREDHKVEMKEVTQAVTNNTIAVNSLVESLKTAGGVGKHEN